MKHSSFRHCRPLALALFISSGIFATAHPGPPGHDHPDEVDEFDQVSMVSSEALQQSDVNLGGIVVLMFMGACLGFAFLQREGGIWKDATANH